MAEIETKTDHSNSGEKMLVPIVIDIANDNRFDPFHTPFASWKLAGKGLTNQATV